MKGLIRKCLSVLGLTGGLALAVGCDHYRNLVDPCWPERYSYQSRTTIRETFAAQANNGHVLDQTVWSYHFEPGTDKLTAAGKAHLAVLARRRPAVDPTIYLQMADDLAYDPKDPNKLASERAGLHAKRAQAIQNYLAAHTAGRGVDFQVVVHDPAEVGQSANPVLRTVTQNHAQALGGLPQTAGAGSQSVVGGAGVGAAGSGR